MIDLFSKENSYKIIETMSEGLMLINSSGRILYINKALEEMLQYTKEELIGKKCDILECDSCFGAKQKGKGKFCGLFQSGEVRALKCAFRRKDGSLVSVFKNAAILRDDAGNILAGVENLTDMSAIEEKDRVISFLKRHLHHEEGFQGLIGNTPMMRKLFDLTRSAAQSDSPAIIYGESGTGKELIASALHRLSSRRDKPYIKVNCAALNENLLESELFGHARGAFTGAQSDRVGRFEAADGGVIFLDEIGDMPPPLQTKLLRVLQEQEIERVGDHQPIPINVRIISATNKNLQKLIKEGLFREDLYYRIGVIPICTPSLRERKEDIPLLVETFIERTSLKTGKEIHGVSRETMELLVRYNWPGNVRELINVIEYAYVLCPGGLILPDHLPSHFAGHPKILNIPQVKSRINKAENERQRLLQALKAADGNKSEAARILGISRVTLWKRLKKHQIEINHTIDV
ncbi:MAG: sigma-54-dependent Fis family transcriptional regulator [Desulfobulbaceae bacterium DB1]|nr:MAG: sigma-54-dependent Fis family transcriptional regulator [Desulfobulbaceae bacterium DB1]